MARKKIRNYATTEDIKLLFNAYFVENREEVMKYLLDTLGFNTEQELRDAERNMYFGFDCGWVYIETKNDKQYHEWELDNDKWSAKVYGIRPPYDCQSITPKRIQIEYALEKLGLKNQYWVSVTYD